MVTVVITVDTVHTVVDTVVDTVVILAMVWVAMDLVDTVWVDTDLVGMDMENHIQNTATVIVVTTDTQVTDCTVNE